MQAIATNLNIQSQINRKLITCNVCARLYQLFMLTLRWQLSPMQMK